MAQKTLNKFSIILIHILIWILMSYVFLFHNPILSNGYVPMVFWVQQVIRILILVIIFYVNGSVIFDRTIKIRKYGLFIVWVLVSVFCTSLLSGYIEKMLQIHDVLNKMHIPSPPPETFDGFMLLTSLMVLGISTSIEAVKSGQKDNQLREEVEKQMALTELAQLKSQINPHFFFNTLNNIYSLSYIDIDESRKLILKLSRMMRYLIYETKPDRASLQRELEFLNDYIELHKIRLSENVHLVFKISELNTDYNIAPMVLLPFVENAFKHGIDNQKGNFVTIQICVKDGNVSMHLENSIVENVQLEKGGLGIENTVKRLDIIYGKKYSLDIIEDHDRKKYSVDLQIALL